MLTPIQLRMARSAVALSVRDLAELAKVAPNTITRMEGGAKANNSTQAALRAALEARGVVFLADGEHAPGGPGVRLASGQPSAYERLVQFARERLATVEAMAALTAIDQEGILLGLSKEQIDAAKRSATGRE